MNPEDLFNIFDIVTKKRNGSLILEVYAIKVKKLRHYDGLIAEATNLLEDREIASDPTIRTLIRTQNALKLNLRDYVRDDNTGYVWN